MICQNHFKMAFHNGEEKDSASALSFGFVCHPAAALG